ncbi:MAG: hypothetical protein QM692_20650 [Thermomicrobiales bacterium]
MESQTFDALTVELASERGPSRRAVLGGLLAGGIGLLAALPAAAGKKRRHQTGKKRNKGKGKGNRPRKNQQQARCSGEQTRCDKACVNTNTDSNHCGACGIVCASGEQCIHGRCFSPDICPAGFQSCPDFQRCSVDDSDCFCGTTTGGQTVCFQDEDFCEAPRPCVTTSDCEQGRVCLDSTSCCEARNMPAVNRTCVLPCANQPQVNQALQLPAGQKGGPGV